MTQWGVRTCKCSNFRNIQIPPRAVKRSLKVHLFKPFSGCIIKGRHELQTRLLVTVQERLWCQILQSFYYNTLDNIIKKCKDERDPSSAVLYAVVVYAWRNQS